MRYIFGICKFTVNAMFHAKKLRLRHSLLCYCFHRSVSDCLVESRQTRAKKCGFLKPQLKSFGVGGNLSFWKKSLSFLTIFLSFSGSLSFFGLEFFSKCPKKKPDYSELFTKSHKIGHSFTLGKCAFSNLTF